MAVGFYVYKFNLNQSATGEIEPEFQLLASQSKVEQRKDVISANDLYGLFFNHTSGLLFKSPEERGESVLVQRLKETPYKIVSEYYQAADESQYLTITAFRLDEDAELVEPILRQMGKVLRAEVFDALAIGDAGDLSFHARVQEKLENLLKFYSFQVDRSSNLDKLQKVALIYATPDRLQVLEALREGPAHRELLARLLERSGRGSNLDAVLKPFVELNLIRRDWARGELDRRKGVVHGEGEHVFLVKDVALARAPPHAALKNDSPVRAAHKKLVDDYFSSYDPFDNLSEESRLLALCVVDPELYDFMALLRAKPYPLEKIKTIASDYSSVEGLLEPLVEAELVAILKDAGGTEWTCLVADVVPLVVFPEYLVTRVLERTTRGLTAALDEESDVWDEHEQWVPKSGEPAPPITREVARIALSLLESTYNERVEF
ncbi:MAG: hypothetical protein Kow0069_29870 [Promethearchaeota archaeon]